MKYCFHLMVVSVLMGCGVEPIGLNKQPETKGGASRGFALSTYSWAQPLNISVSYPADGTVMVGGKINNLNATYNAKYPEVEWKRVIASVLHRWAEVIPVNFHFVSDNGAPSGTNGAAQANEHFGDIRIGGYVGSPDYLANSYNPIPIGTLGGDLFINTVYAFSLSDLRVTVLHEIGHALGLNHNVVPEEPDICILPGTLMCPFVGEGQDLTYDEVRGVQEKYGLRMPDQYDTQAANNSFDTATSLQFDSCQIGNIEADLTPTLYPFASPGFLARLKDIRSIDPSLSWNSTITTIRDDVDYYKVTIPSGCPGTLTVVMDSTNLSLLVPKLAIFNDAGERLISAKAGPNDYGTSVTAHVPAVVGKTYFIKANGPKSVVFKTGAYRLGITLQDL